MISRLNLGIVILLLCTLACLGEEKRPILERVSESVWIHKSYEEIEPWGLVLSQGLFIQTSGQIVMVDTAWNDKDTEKLFQLCKDQFGTFPQKLIVTHAHADKMGGMRAAHRLNPKLHSYAHPYTIEDAPKRKLMPSTNTLADWAEQVSIEIYYPGPGHARDNVVVYHPGDKILFGGCLVRPGGSKNLGNTGDANVALWADSVERVRSHFGRAKIVIPSHGPRSGLELLAHTIELANSASLQEFWTSQKQYLGEKNTAALAEMFNKDSRLTTLAGGQIQGKEAIEEFWTTSLHRLGPEAELDWQLLEINQTSAASATIHGQWTARNGDLPEGYPAFGYFLQELRREKANWKVDRAYFWPVTEGHTRHLRP